MIDKTAKVPVTLRIDVDVLDGFRALAESTPGAKYQSLMNDALKAHLEREKTGSLEARVEKLEQLILNRKKT